MIEQVVAKMACHTTQTLTGAGSYQMHKVNLGAVYSHTGENKDFCDATPSGECWMNIAPGYPAADFFKPGKKYYVTFTEAPD
jgi:hypothetical protein